MKRIVVAMTGASGQIYGIRLLEALRKVEDVETHLVMSAASAAIIPQETSWKASDVKSLADVSYKPKDIGAPIASGSFETAGMVIAPCSIKTLSAVANSYASDLIVRAADVTLKEGRPLILMVRETPFHLGHLRLMERAAEIGAVIFPPIPAFYTKPSTIDDIVDNTVGRVLARLGIENFLYRKWEGWQPPSGGDE